MKTRITTIGLSKEMRLLRNRKCEVGLKALTQLVPAVKQNPKGRKIKEK